MANFASQRNKVPKSQQITEPFILHEIHSPEKVKERKWVGNSYRIVSIDPAWKNFTLRLEERLIESGSTVKSIIFDKKTFENNRDYRGLTEYLTQWLDHFKTCHFIIIEKQPPINYATVRQSQHVLSFFMLHLANTPLLPILCEMDTHTKGTVLGVKKKLSHTDLKKWSVEMARQLLTNAGDKEGLAVLERFKKKDDLADTVVMIEAFFRLNNLQPQVQFEPILL